MSIVARIANDFQLNTGITARERSCHVCGCTWHNACPGSCWWIGQDLCSSCGPEAARHLRTRPMLRRPRRFHWTRQVDDQGFVVWRLTYVRGGRPYGVLVRIHRREIQKYGRVAVARELHRARFTARLDLLDRARSAEGQPPTPTSNR